MPPILKHVKRVAENGGSDNKLDTLNILRFVEGSTSSPKSVSIFSFVEPPENSWTHLRISGHT